MQHSDDLAFQAFVEDGCGRCSLYKTDACKAVRWRSLIEALRSLIMTSGLDESFKWSQPCYTFQGKNVLILSAMKDYAFISFFKGALLSNEEGRLIQPGERSMHSRQLRYTDLYTLHAEAGLIMQKVQEAITIEQNGLHVNVVAAEEPIPIELIDRFRAEPEFEKAFYALTPGRQRAYLIHFNQAKQSKTRSKRIEQHRSNIMQGIGMHDAYQRKQ